MFKKIIKHIPILPLSALIFLGFAMVLWNIGIIPEPKEILQILENLYYNYGFLGLIIATFLESLVYIGMYFPGSLIIALAVFLSDGSFASLLTISILVALTLTVTAVINYLAGRFVSSRNFFEKKEFIRESEVLSKGLLVSMLHPNLLAFYFFNAGLEKKNFKKIIYLPFFMIPYGYLFALLLSKFSEPARQGLENPNIILAIIAVWLVFTFVLELRKSKKAAKQSAGDRS